MKKLSKKEAALAELVKHLTMIFKVELYQGASWTQANYMKELVNTFSTAVECGLNDEDMLACMKDWKRRQRKLTAKAKEDIELIRTYITAWYTYYTLKKKG